MFSNTKGVSKEEGTMSSKYTYEFAYNPCKYKGQKQGELAMIINNLAEQAGVYTYYVDLFGGSGSATAALYQRDDIRQVYNELHRTVYNYFEVISGDKYEELKDAIRNIQEDLKSVDFDFDRIYKFDMQSTIHRYTEYKVDNQDSASEDVISREKHLSDMINSKFTFDEAKVSEFMANFPSKVDFYVNNSEKKIPDGLDLDEVKTWNTKEDFYNHFDSIKMVSDALLARFFNVDEIQGVDSNGKSRTYDDYLWDVRQAKALGYFAHFYLLRNDGKGISDDKKVEYAVGEIFLQYMNTHDDIRSSAIVPENGRNLRVNSFVDDEVICENIDSFHKRVYQCNQDGLLRNSDFSEVIKEFAEKEETALFYIDSPYAGTSDYKDEVNGITKFESEDMQKLIRMLIESNQKFIFSMRAVITGGNKSAKIKGNKELKENVYNQFAKYAEADGKKLQVLVILDQGKELADCIKKSEVVEIMVTSFPVEGTNIEIYKASTVSKYKSIAYDFSEYMAILEENTVLN